jgi:hypothetical protein
MNRLRWTFILFIYIFPSLCNAQEEESVLYKKEFQIMAGFNSQQAVELEPAFSYMITPNIGVVTGVNLMTAVA